MALSIFKLLFGNKADTSQETDHSESSIQEKHNIQSRSQGEENNVFVLNSGKASKITLIGASNSSAETIKRMCDNYSSYYDAVKSIIAKIYRCEDIDLTTPLDIFFHDFEGIERPIEVILLSVKWLFMEQDCAYWNYSGRKMFYSGLLEQGLV